MLICPHSKQKEFNSFQLLAFLSVFFRFTAFLLDAGFKQEASPLGSVAAAERSFINKRISLLFLCFSIMASGFTRQANVFTFVLLCCWMIYYHLLKQRLLYSSTLLFFQIRKQLVGGFLSLTLFQHKLSASRNSFNRVLEVSTFGPKKKRADQLNCIRFFTFPNDSDKFFLILGISITAFADIHF